MPEGQLLHFLFPFWEGAAGSQSLLLLVLLVSFFLDAVQWGSVTELLKTQPDAIPSVIGYNTVPGYHQLSRLHNGEVLNTTDSFANVTDGSALELTVLYAGGNTAMVLSSAWLECIPENSQCEKTTNLLQ